MHQVLSHVYIPLAAVCFIAVMGVNGADATTPAAPPARVDMRELAPHPRLWISGNGTCGAPTVELLKKRAAQPEAQCFWSAVRDSHRIDCLALVYLLTGDQDALDRAVGMFRATRSAERLMGHALAFDWLYQGLTEEQRSRTAAILLESAEMMPAQRYATITDFLHNFPSRYTAAACMAALAAANEYPERAQPCFDWGWPYQRQTILCTGDRVADPDPLNPEHPLLGGGWPEGHDYDRHSSVPSVALWLALRSAAGLDFVRGSRYLDHKLLWYYHALMPSGDYILPVGDNDWAHRVPLPHDLALLSMSAAAEGPHAPFLRAYLREMTPHDRSAAATFIFVDPSAPKRDPTDLPTDYFAPGVGTATFRSGWGRDASFVGVQASDFFTYHQQNQNGAFYLYRNAPLAWRSGVYDGLVHDHNCNYVIRTIAANCITVFDPAEEFRVAEVEAANDGGQVVGNWRPKPDGFASLLEMRRDPNAHIDRATWLACESSDSYGYAAFEYGRSYRVGKVPEALRQVVFLKPDWVIVLDRVTAGDPAFQKTFVLHAPDELLVDRSAATTTIVTRGEIGAAAPGKLFCKTLLPAGAELARVGGPGSEFWVDGANRPPRSLERHLPYQLPGVYRLEVRAPRGELTTAFLHVFYLCPTVETAEMPAVALLADEPTEVTLSLAGGGHVLRFPLTGPADWEWVKGGHRTSR